MLKKNKLPILLLACVLMLSIFYVREAANSGTSPANTDVIGDVDTRYAVYAEARFDLVEERNAQIEELEASVAAGTKSSAEIEEIILQINSIYEIKYLEIALENEIIAMGYQDVLVVATDNTVDIDILTDNFTTSNFVSVALLAKEKFSKNHAVTVVLSSPTA